MKRLFTYALAAVAICACIASCKNNKGTKAAEGESDEAGIETETVAENESSEEADAAQLAFEDRHMICPFSIQDKGKVDEAGEMVVIDHKFISDRSQIGGGTVADWVYSCMAPMCNFNTEGWHFVGKDIVNGDETYKIDDEWVGEDACALSSFCTVPTVKYEKPAKVEPYIHMRWGSVQAFAEENELPLRLTGNRHSYDTEKLEEYASSENYETYPVQANFYLNEYIELRSNESTKDLGLKAVCLPYHDTYEAVVLDDALLEQALFTHDMNECDETGLFFSDYINIECPEGVYDLVFFKGSEPFARISLFLTKEDAQQ
ncbi:MAG: hypothetical protein MJY86_04115 [Bacteroidales bacterium]|nr:hypothetical protein [Candidatus Cryptobacteroides faecihippi]MCQ2162445.1 hypothetical protein [Bacteroidales bacterium]